MPRFGGKKQPTREQLDEAWRKGRERAKAMRKALHRTVTRKGRVRA